MDGGVSGAEVRVGGQKLDDKIGQTLVEARIQENLRLPDACLLRFSDPGLKNIDTFPLKIGSEIEVLLSAVEGTSLSSIFKGVIVSLEPEFDKGTTLGFRAYDGSHTLNQTKRADSYTVADRTVFPAKHLVTGKQELQVQVKSDALGK